MIRGLARSFVVTCFLLWLAPVKAQSTTGPALEEVSATYRTDRILVRFKADVPAEKRLAFIEAQGLKVRRHLRILENAEVLDLPADITVKTMIDRCKASDLVEIAEPDYWVHAFLSPNDPSYVNGTLWNLNNTGRSGGKVDADIDAPEAWDTLTDAGNVIVAVIDSGIRYTHQDLAGNMWSNPGETGLDSLGRDKATNRIDDDGNGYVDDVHGIDTILNTGDPRDPDGHGTHVAGIIGGVGNNRLGVVGIAWKVRLMGCRFLDSRGNGSITDAIECIDYARNHGATILNASWGNQSNSLFMEAAIRQCRASGIILVAAAGNEAADNDSVPSYPAGYSLDNVVSVTATTRTDALVAAANHGASSVDLAAPGDSIYSTYNRSDSSYAYLSGTSMAVPHVSGALALVRQRFPGEHYAQNINRLLATTDPVDSLKNKTVSGGRLNLDNLLRARLAADFAADTVSGSPPLTVRFSSDSFGEALQFSWDFGDGTPGSTERNPRHVFENQGDYAVKLTIQDAAGNSSTKSRLISVAANYMIREEVFDWVDSASMPSLRLSDDGVSDAQALPFEFMFYGNRYREIFVSANGLIGFLRQGLETPYNSDLPSGAAPNAIICPWWDDLNPVAGGGIRIGTSGAAPKRRLVISWINVPHQSQRASSFTFQTFLNEDTNEIVFQYLDVDSGQSRGAGRTAAVGIENATGTMAKLYSYGGSALLRNRQAIGFVPAESGGLLVRSTADFALAGRAGGPFSPAAQTFTMENTSNIALPWAVRSTAEWITLSEISGTLLPSQQIAVSATVNSVARVLTAGVYSGAVFFENLRNGNGNTVRDVVLTVTGSAPSLTVSPALELSSSGFTGGPFNPKDAVYRVRNAGDANLQWVSETEAAWISIAPGRGSLAPGEVVNVKVSVGESARELADGLYATRIVFRSQTDPENSTDREVILTVISPNGELTLEPQDGVHFLESIPIGRGVARAEITLMNPSSASLSWRASSGELWASLDPDYGRIEPGQAVAVSVFLNENANLLELGTHQSIIAFSSTGGAATAALEVTLKLMQPLMLVPRIFDTPIFSVELEVSGEAGQYTIETSENLNHWTPLQSVSITGDRAAKISDPKADGLSSRFYRAVALP